MKIIDYNGYTKIALCVSLLLLVFCPLTEQANADYGGSFEEGNPTNNVIILASIGAFLIISTAVIIVFMCGFCMNPEVSSESHKSLGASRSANYNYNFEPVSMNQVNSNVLEASTSVYDDAGPGYEAALPYALNPRVGEAPGFAGYADTNSQPNQVRMNVAPDLPPSYNEATTRGLAGY